MNGEAWLLISRIPMTVAQQATHSARSATRRLEPPLGDVPLVCLAKPGLESDSRTEAELLFGSRIRADPVRWFCERRLFARQQPGTSPERRDHVTERGAGRHERAWQVHLGNYRAS